MHHGYSVGVPAPGFYRECLNTDAGLYWGSNVGNQGGVPAAEEPRDNQPCSITVVLPPLATLVFQLVEE